VDLTPRLAQKINKISRLALCQVAFEAEKLAG